MVRRMNDDSEELLRLFIDQAPVPIAMFDREMRYIAASRRWVSDYGLGDKKWRDVCHYEVFPDLPVRWRAVHRRAMYGEIITCDEDRYDRADGVVQWLRWEVRPWYRESEQGGIIIFAEDITERKKAQDSLLKLNAELEQRVQERTSHLQQALDEAERLRRELREQAIRDPLTGLFNRRFMEESLSREVARARRADCGLGLLMLDMDNFKKVNDTWGHVAGDGVLRRRVHRDDARRVDRHRDQQGRKTARHVEVRDAGIPRDETAGGEVLGGGRGLSIAGQDGRRPAGRSGRRVVSGQAGGRRPGAELSCRSPISRTVTVHIVALLHLRPC
jgi:PAS domain S-box-containing protein